MLIQSLRKRPDGTKINLFDRDYHFQDNEHGHEVCEIDHPESIHRLVVEIPEGFKIYGDDELPTLPKKVQSDQVLDIAAKRMPAVPDKMIITDGEQEIDLMKLGMDELKALATGTFGLTLHHKWNEQTIRFKIVEKTRVA